MGILPLQFINGEGRKSLNLKGPELISILNIENGFKPLEKIKIQIKKQDSVKLISVLCIIDTVNELEYFKNGGILNYVLRKMA